jgi:hypothetical protein
VDNGLSQGFGSYLACCASLSPLLSSPLPSLPFPSLHLASALVLASGRKSSSVLCSDAGAGVRWNAGHGGVRCDVNAGAGVASVRLQVQEQRLDES